MSECSKNPYLNGNKLYQDDPRKQCWECRSNCVDGYLPAWKYIVNCNDNTELTFPFGETLYKFEGILGISRSCIWIPEEGQEVKQGTSNIALVKQEGIERWAVIWLDIPELPAFEVEAVVEPGEPHCFGDKCYPKGGIWLLDNTPSPDPQIFPDVDMWPVPHFFEVSDLTNPV